MANTTDNHTNEHTGEKTGEPSISFHNKSNAATAGHGETLLVVEDEANVQKLMKRMLEGLGYTVLTAGSAKEALQLSASHGQEIRLVITDVNMPGMDGWALADRLNNLHPNLNILFMSGYSSAAISQMGMPDQKIHFIEKPFSIATLTGKVHEVLAQTPVAE